MLISILLHYFLIYYLTKLCILYFYFFILTDYLNIQMYSNLIYDLYICILYTIFIKCFRINICD